MKIAIIGSGNVGTALGLGWMKAGHEVIFGVRNPSSTKSQKALEKMQTKKDLAQRQGLAMDSSDTNELYQNTPNPFSQNTVIAYKIVSTATKASTQIFDMTGKTIKKIEVLPSSTQITLEANGLTPGMYMYALVVDGKLVDTKRMILE